jgi:hypothetical protein
MVRAGLPMATRAPVLLLAVRNGGGVDRAMLTVGQDVKQGSAPVMEEAAHHRLRIRQLKAQPQPHRQLQLLAVAVPLGMSHGQRLVLYPTAASFTTV